MLSTSSTLHMFGGEKYVNKYDLCEAVRMTSWTALLRGSSTELAEVLTEPTSIISQQAWVTRGYQILNTHLYKGWERGFGELQTCQPDLRAGQVTEQVTLSATTGQPGDQAWPAWGWERQALPDQPALLL